MWHHSKFFHSPLHCIHQHQLSPWSDPRWGSPPLILRSQSAVVESWPPAPAPAPPAAAAAAPRCSALPRVLELLLQELRACLQPEGWGQLGPACCPSPRGDQKVPGLECLFRAGKPNREWHNRQGIGKIFELLSIPVYLVKALRSVYKLRHMLKANTCWACVSILGTCVNSKWQRVSRKRLALLHEARRVIRKTAAVCFYKHALCMSYFTSWLFNTSSLLLTLALPSLIIFNTIYLHLTLLATYIYLYKYDNTHTHVHSSSFHDRCWVSPAGGTVQMNFNPNTVTCQVVKWLHASERSPCLTRAEVKK